MVQKKNLILFLILISIIFAVMPLSKREVTTSQNNSGSWSEGVWVSYGDSITVSNAWQPYVTEYFNFKKHHLLGIGGITVAKNGYDSNFPDIDRIKTIPKHVDLIVIMGGTNDMGQNIPIGNLENGFDETTFKGALASTIIKIQKRVPSARLVVMSPLSGRGKEPGKNMTRAVTNKLGLTTEDYARASEEVAHKLSIPFIDVFGKTGINPFNRSQYISDTVHPNKLGGQRIAEVVIGGLKRIEPITKLEE